MITSLPRPQAFVLFELLSRSEESGRFDLMDSAEEKVLWKVLAPLEKALAEPLRPDYEQTLEEARQRVREQG